MLLNDISTKDDTGKVCHLPVTIFADANMNGEEPLLFQQLRGAAQSKTAMAFFGIQGKKSTGQVDGWSFQSSFDFFCADASETKKGEELEATWEEVQDAEAETVPQSVLVGENEEENINFENVAATETMCARLKSMLEDSGVSDIE